MKNLSVNHQIRKIVRITITWTLISILNAAISLAFLFEMGYDFSKRNPYIVLQASILTGILAGVVGGFMLVYKWEKWLRSQPYGIALKKIIISYTLIFYCVAIPTTLFYNLNYTEFSITESALWKEVIHAHFRPSLYVTFIFWLIIVILTMITFLVDDKYGPGVFKKFLLGKYFTPSREERIFMFLDLKSSTTIAEKLGEENYFSFIRDTFKAVTPAIIHNKAEVYQYVGDEIVLSWSMDDSIATNSCIECFFECKEILKAIRNYFMDNYGEVPVFKAGIHFGMVMAGEVGVIKREIAYSGDVLNTTSRIQGMCNQLHTDILISEELSEKLKLSKTYNLEDKGSISLRGKHEEVNLLTFSPA